MSLDDGIPQVLHLHSYVILRKKTTLRRAMMMSQKLLK
jgi:hypothetical protein